MTLLVQRPRASADRPHPLGLVAIAALGLGLGAAVPQLATLAPAASLPPHPLDRRATPVAPGEAHNVDPAPPSVPPSAPRPVALIPPAARQQDTGADHPAAAPTHDPPPDRAITKPAASAPIAAAGPPPAVPNPSATPPQPAGTEVQPQHRGRPPRRMLAGRLAYVRCDGVPVRPGPYPCPRDRELEQQVWRVLHSVGECGLDAGAGHGDLRLEFQAGGPPEVRLREVRDAASRVDSEVVIRCAGTDLAELRTGLAPERMVVSFRFQLR